ncbi:hypothetical protein CVT24_005495 [Panaeolus cyanescens]|uniref:Uncharacterized protein n=1 Tax=Panaeolus cyanescens TaxID=181874 RepID=A0A409YC84_9AGAR|nr:hypothetical protein CVT24_005495 [Panaeolus cyanescens]
MIKRGVLLGTLILKPLAELPSESLLHSPFPITGTIPPQISSNSQVHDMNLPPYPFNPSCLPAYFTALVDSETKAAQGWAPKKDCKEGRDIIRKLVYRMQVYEDRMWQAALIPGFLPHLDTYNYKAPAVAVLYALTDTIHTRVNPEDNWFESLRSEVSQPKDLTYSDIEPLLLDSINSCHITVKTIERTIMVNPQDEAFRKWAESSLVSYLAVT